MDNNVSDQVRERLQKLTEQFIDSLPEKIEHLKTVITQMHNAAAPDKMFWDRTRKAFHKVAGTGATLGFRETTEKAREIELFLDYCVQRKERVGEAERKHLEDLHAKIVKNCEKIRGSFLASVRQQEPLPEPAADASRHIVLYKSEKFFSDESRDHLKVFGYSVLSVDSLETVRQLLLEGKTLVLILDAGTFPDEPESHELLHKMCHRDNEYNENLKVVYLCEWDNFDTRMFAVRTCGKAFIPAPFDVPHL
ncbi:MAG: Hpt domain-containing protein, partial [Spirochaetaceae bacterium]|nr:Hpt domain-containing protein [Spirochaetaceae bacterium]